MAKNDRPKRRSGRRGMKIPLGITLGGAVSVWQVWNYYKSCRIAGWQPGEALAYSVTGWNPKDKTWHKDVAFGSLAPIGVGAAVSYLASDKGIGLNRRLSQVPLVKL